MRASLTDLTQRVRKGCRLRSRTGASGRFPYCRRWRSSERYQAAGAGRTQAPLDHARGRTRQEPARLACSSSRRTAGDWLLPVRPGHAGSGFRHRTRPFVAATAQRRDGSALKQARGLSAFRSAQLRVPHLRVAASRCTPLIFAQRSKHAQRNQSLIHAHSESCPAQNVLVKLTPMVRGRTVSKARGSWSEAMASTSARLSNRLRAKMATVHSS